MNSDATGFLTTTETFEDFLVRLDSAIEDAIERDIFADEINQ